MRPATAGWMPWHPFSCTGENERSRKEGGRVFRFLSTLIVGPVNSETCLNVMIAASASSFATAFLFAGIIGGALSSARSVLNVSVFMPSSFGLLLASSHLLPAVLDLPLDVGRWTPSPWAVDVGHLRKGHDDRDSHADIIQVVKAHPPFLTRSPAWSAGYWSDNGRRRPYETVSGKEPARSCLPDRRLMMRRGNCRLSHRWSPNGSGIYGRIKNICFSNHATKPFVFSFKPDKVDNRTILLLMKMNLFSQILR